MSLDKYHEQLDKQEDHTGTLGKAMLKAGLHVGRGKGAILVRRNEVEQFFLDRRNDGNFYSLKAIASVIKQGAGLRSVDLSRSVGIHCYKMFKAGLLLKVRAGKSGLRYKAASNFTKLTPVQRKKRHPAYGKERVIAGPDPIEERMNAITKPSPPLQKKLGLEEQLRNMRRLATVMLRQAEELEVEYTEMKEKLEKLL